MQSIQNGQYILQRNRSISVFDIPNGVHPNAGTFCEFGSGPVLLKALLAYDSTHGFEIVFYFGRK